jgi:hypothetical protein
VLKNSATLKSHRKIGTNSLHADFEQTQFVERYFFRTIFRQFGHSRRSAEFFNTMRTFLPDTGAAKITLVP